MIESSLSADRITLFRVVMFWTLLLSALLTASDDFSVANAPRRFIYWASHIGLGLIVVSLVTRWLQRAWLYRLGEWTQLGISTVVAVVVFAPVGIILDLVLPKSLGPDGHADVASSMHEQGFVRAALDEIASSAPTVIAVWLIVHLSYRFLNALGNQKPKDAALSNCGDTQINITTQVAPNGILDKIPKALGNDVVLLRSDANYVHVHTTIGKTMFLYSLARASEELDSRGLLVHRSFWISFDHVRAVQRRGSQTVCLMADGTTVPVSRRRQKTVFDHFGKDFVRKTAVFDSSAGENRSPRADDS